MPSGSSDHRDLICRCVTPVGMKLVLGMAVTALGPSPGREASHRWKVHMRERFRTESKLLVAARMRGVGRGLDVLEAAKRRWRKAVGAPLDSLAGENNLSLVGSNQARCV